MENKSVGWLIIGISVVIIAIIFIFNSALHEIVMDSCGAEHSLVCPMNQTINNQTYFTLAIVGVLIIIGLVLIFSKPREKIIVRTLKEKQIKKEYDLSKFTKEEKLLFNYIRENKAVFQADLIEKLNLGKAKVTRIIDRLEGQGYVERKRRGMNNIVTLKDN